jgi:segregation and condensation protein A
MDAPLQFHLDGYQGPLDLLLDLIRKQEIDIYDIPIHKITAQYLDIIHQMDNPDSARGLDIEQGGEFVLMAATLIHIKSKMLLPADPSIPKDQQEDPRMELVNQLLEHEKFKHAAQMLQQKQMLEHASWSNPALKQFLTDGDGEDPGLAVSIFDLVETFNKILERAKNRPQISIFTEEFTVEQMIERVRDRLAETRGTTALTELFAPFTKRRTLITMFLAILEMVRLHAVVVRQDESFGEIMLKKGAKFDVLFESGALAAAMGALEEKPDALADEKPEGAEEPNEPESTN